MITEMDLRVDSRYTSVMLENERSKLRMTQQDVANAIGVSVQSVCNWENGKMPSLWNLMALSCLYEVPINRLVLYRNSGGVQ